MKNRCNILTRHHSPLHTRIPVCVCPWVASFSSGRSTPSPPLRTKIFVISCSFLGKSGKFVCWHPLLKGWRPLQREILDPSLFSMYFATQGCTGMRQVFKKFAREGVVMKIVQVTMLHMKTIVYRCYFHSPLHSNVCVYFLYSLK